MISTEPDWFGAQDLEGRLNRYLGIPTVQPGHHPSGVDERFELVTIGAIRELRRELFELRREASEIGKIPRDYPAHIVVIMKVISAFLPWYTRPLLNFARRAARISDIMAKVLEEVLSSHELLVREVAAVRNQRAGSGKEPE